MESLIKTALKVAEFHLGRELLLLVISRILYDLSLTNEKLKEVKIPEAITEMDFSLFDEVEKKAFYYQLVDILGLLVGEEVKHSLLQRQLSPN